MPDCRFQRIRSNEIDFAPQFFGQVRLQAHEGDPANGLRKLNQEVDIA